MKIYHFSTKATGLITALATDEDIVYSLPDWLRSAKYMNIDYLRAQLTKHEGFKELTNENT